MEEKLVPLPELRGSLAKLDSSNSDTFEGELSKSSVSFFQSEDLGGSLGSLL